MTGMSELFPPSIEPGTDEFVSPETMSSGSAKFLKLQVTGGFGFICFFLIDISVGAKQQAVVALDKLAKIGNLEGVTVEGLISH